MKSRVAVLVLVLALPATGCQVTTEPARDPAPGMHRDAGPTMGSGNRADHSLPSDALSDTSNLVDGNVFVEDVLGSTTTDGGNMMGSGN